MRLHTLTLEQFRSYAHLDFSCDSECLQFFYGGNGVGKTNILEALCVLALGKSFRTERDHELVQWGASHYRLQGTLECDNHEKLLLEVVCEIQPRRQKAFFVNGVRVSFRQFLGRMLICIFLPEDLSLFTGSPSHRRRFLDVLLSQLSPEYLTSFVHYRRVLHQLHSLLRRMREGEAVAEMDVWERALARSASVLTLARLELLETLTMLLPQELLSLGLPWEHIELRYSRAVTARDLASLEQEFIHLFCVERARSIAIGSILIGPHRDDWTLFHDQRDIACFASRGEQRLCLIALLFLQASYMQLRSGSRPIIILDDVLSELDAEHQHFLLNSLDEHQVFLTTAQSVETLRRSGSFWSVASGCVTPLQSFCTL